MHRFFLSTAVIAVVLLGISTHCEGEAVRFSADVWPILAERCIRCHGSEKQEGDLRLDTPEGINVGGEFGIVVAAGDPDGSTLVELISLPEDDPDVMPAKGDALSSEEIDLLTRWITEGASLEGWTQSLADQANSDAEVFWAKKKATVVVLPASFTSDVEEIEFN
ncbi:MAG TPA: hypothetical protein EYN96_06650, partial [Candidatus Hydrogenedentes bacterium]|nr:hypothetical protein [Candidatus Hydrogenedentota bacterium]